MFNCEVAELAQKLYEKCKIKQHEMLCKACVRMNDFDIRNYTFKQVELIESVSSINVVDIDNFKNTTFKFEVAYQLLYKGKPIDK